MITPVAPSVTTRPRDGESFRAFLIRSCQRNGWPSLVRFLHSTGLVISDIAAQPDCDRVASALGLNPPALETFKRWGNDPDRKSWPATRARKTQRFYCPQCLAEHQFQPAWCDLDFITTCPIHQVSLVGTCGCGAPLGFRDHTIEHCPQCAALVCHLTSPPERVADKPFERYALGRLGVIPPTAVPVLDELPFLLALQWVEALAGLAVHGYSGIRLTLPEGPERPARREAAFALMQAGDLSPLFRSVTREFYQTSRALSLSTPIASLGSFADTARRVAAYPAISELTRKSLGKALGFPVFDFDQCDYVHIDTVAHETRSNRAAIVIWLVHRNLMHLCYPLDEDLYLPIDIAWKLMGQRSGAKASTISATPVSG